MKLKLFNSQESAKTNPCGIVFTGLGAPPYLERAFLSSLWRRGKTSQTTVIRMIAFGISVIYHNKREGEAPCTRYPPFPLRPAVWICSTSSLSLCVHLQRNKPCFCGYINCVPCCCHLWVTCIVSSSFCFHLAWVSLRWLESDWSLDILTNGEKIGEESPFKALIGTLRWWSDLLKVANHIANAGETFIYQLSSLIELKKKKKP